MASSVCGKVVFSNKCCLQFGLLMTFCSISPFFSDFFWLMLKEMLARLHGYVLSACYTDKITKAMFILAFFVMFLIMGLLVKDANFGRK